MYRYLSKRSFSTNPLSSKSLKEIKVGTNLYKYFNINSLGNVGNRKNNYHQTNCHIQLEFFSKAH